MAKPLHTDKFREIIKALLPLEKPRLLGAFRLHLMDVIQHTMCQIK